VPIVWRDAQANHASADIRARVTTPDVISAIVVMLGDAAWSVRQAGVKALVELAKFGMSNF
jgi:hypothetical protein